MFQRLSGFYEGLCGFRQVGRRDGAAEADEEIELEEETTRFEVAVQ